MEKVIAGTANSVFSDEGMKLPEDRAVFYRINICFLDDTQDSVFRINTLENGAALIRPHYRHYSNALKKPKTNILFDPNHISIQKEVNFL